MQMCAVHTRVTDVHICTCYSVCLCLSHVCTLHVCDWGTLCVCVCLCVLKTISVFSNHGIVAQQQSGSRFRGSFFLMSASPITPGSCFYWSGVAVSWAKSWSSILVKSEHTLKRDHTDHLKGMTWGYGVSEPPRKSLEAPSPLKPTSGESGVNSSPAPNPLVCICK